MWVPGCIPKSDGLEVTILQPTYFGFLVEKKLTTARAWAISSRYEEMVGGGLVGHA